MSGGGPQPNSSSISASVALSNCQALQDRDFESSEASINCISTSTDLLLPDCLIFHNLCSLTRLVQTLEQRGGSTPADAIAAISSYLTKHINRFGDYALNLARKPPQPGYGYTLKQTASDR